MTFTYFKLSWTFMWLCLCSVWQMYHSWLTVNRKPSLSYCCRCLRKTMVSRGVRNKMKCHPSTRIKFERVPGLVLMLFKLVAICWCLYVLLKFLLSVGLVWCEIHLTHLGLVPMISRWQYLDVQLFMLAALNPWVLHKPSAVTFQRA